MLGASGGDVMQNTAKNLLHVRVCVPTMIPVIPPAFVRAIRDACEAGPLFLREDPSGVAKPKPPLEWDVRDHGTVDGPHNLTITDVEDTIITFVT